MANPIGAITGAAALVTAKILRDRRKGREALLSNSPVAYLFRLEEELSPGTLEKWISDDASKHGLW
jgi:hypothetical protein